MFALPSAAELLFYGFAAIAVVSSLAMVTRKNAIVAALLLVATFFSVAVNYVLLQATFLGVIQVLVYAGAMMVLFVFVIMVLDVDDAGRIEHRRAPLRGGAYGVAFFLGLAFLVWVLIGSLARQYVSPGADLSGQPGFGGADAVGRELFGRYLFAFEGISLLLLAAVIGAVVVARTRAEREDDASELDARARAKAAAGRVPDPVLTRRAREGDI